MMGFQIDGTEGSLWRCCNLKPAALCYGEKERSKDTKHVILTQVAKHTSMEGSTWTSASTQGKSGTRLNSIKTIRSELPDIAESEAVSQHLKHAPFGLLCNWPGLSESLKPSLHNRTPSLITHISSASQPFIPSALSHMSERPHPHQ